MEQLVCGRETSSTGLGIQMLLLALQPALLVTKHQNITSFPAAGQLYGYISCHQDQLQDQKITCDTYTDKMILAVACSAI